MHDIFEVLYFKLPNSISFMRLLTAETCS